LYQLLCCGTVNEFRALVAVGELAKLPAHARREADRLLFAPGCPYSGSWCSTKKLSVAVRSVVSKLDPANAVERHERQRRETSGVFVSLGYDGMATLNAVLPAWQAASIASVIDDATSEVPYGFRGVAQVNELFCRVTGRPTMNVDAADVTINLVISDTTLLGAGHQAVTVLDNRGRGYGSIPAQIARNLIANGLDTSSVWLRRIYSNPAGDLVAATSKQRFFADGLAAMLSIRDQGLCRTPGCDAVIRDLDHVVPYSDGGQTDLMNGAGLCRRCNQMKETLDWSAMTDVDPTTGRHQLTIIDPTGTRYHSTAPPLPVPATPMPATHHPNSTAA
jgi:5-methylcytosine-specific restriction endonuclease McrA